MAVSPVLCTFEEELRISPLARLNQHDADVYIHHTRRLPYWVSALQGDKERMSLLLMANGGWRMADGGVKQSRTRVVGNKKM